MKMINSDNWALRNRRAPHAWLYTKPITDPPVDQQVYFAYSREVAWFYYRLALYGFYGGRLLQ
jgi:hypothetical protein